MSVKKPDRISHKDRREKRRKIAAAVRGGMEIAEATQKFEVGLRTVYDACHEFGVQIPDRRRTAIPA